MGNEKNVRHAGMHAVPIAVAGCRTFNPINDPQPRSKTYASHFPYPGSFSSPALSHCEINASEEATTGETLGEMLSGATLSRPSIKEGLQVCVNSVNFY